MTLLPGALRVSCVPTRRRAPRPAARFGHAIRGHPQPSDAIDGAGLAATKQTLHEPFLAALCLELSVKQKLGFSLQPDDLGIQSVILARCQHAALRGMCMNVRA